MDVLCTDKTGTLTQGKIVLENTWMRTAIQREGTAIRLSEQLPPHRLKNLLDDADPRP